MRIPLIRAILFDHDGTLVDSLPVVVAATNAALAEAGAAACAAEAIVAAMVLPTGPRMAHHAGIADAARQPALAASYYAQAIRLVDRARAYAGIAEALRALADRPLAVVSNNEGRFVRAAMAATGLAAHIPAARAWGEDDVPAPKPDPAGLLAAAQRLGIPAGDCAYVGDSPVDLRAARGAGMRAIGVAWGTHARAQLAGLGFDRLLDHPEQLARL